MYKACAIVFFLTGDYEYGPYNVTFTFGETTTTFIINITDDNIVENTEDFRLTIDQSSLPSEVTLGSIAEATVSIDSEDCKCKSVLYICIYVCIIIFYAVLVASLHVCCFVE